MFEPRGMNDYYDGLKQILAYGRLSTDRTGTGTLRMFGMMHRYDLRETFPLLTGKRLHLKSIIHELLWFLSGDTNIHYLNDNGVTIWDEWADENGELGPVYGHQWRRWAAPPEDDGGPREIDQIKDLMELIKRNPDSRRLLVSAWNPADIPKMALPPCHVMFHAAIIDGELDLLVYQRSADMFLGVPFNIASYALLQHMICAVTGYRPGTFIHQIGDAHIYLNHLDQVKELLDREPPPLPILKPLRKAPTIFDYHYDDFVFEGYDPLPAIKAPVAV